MNELINSGIEKTTNKTQKDFLQEILAIKQESHPYGWVVVDDYYHDEKSANSLTREVQYE